MLSIYVGLVLHLLALTLGADVKASDDGKMVVMLELEPAKAEDRAKRASESEVVRQGRQSVEVPPEYFSLLQSYAAQPQQQQQQPAPAPTQAASLGPQYVVSREEAKQPARYVLSSDGTLLQEGLSQAQPQYATALGQTQLGGLSQHQQYPALGVPVYVQSPLEQTGPQTLPQSPAQTPRPNTRPRISEFARQQQRLLQEYRDAPLRAQIAGVARGPQRQRPVQPVPTGPNSQSAQVFVPPNNQNQRQPQAGLPAPFQDPQNPGIVYTPVPVDAQTYQQYAQQLQQQYAQLQQQYAAAAAAAAPQPQQQYAAQYVPEANQVYTQATRAAPVSPQFYYQQPAETTQEKVRRPAPVLATSAAVQPQYVAQNLPQQYLIETTKPSSPAPPQYVQQEVAPQVTYVQPTPTPVRHETAAPAVSTLLQPVAGRGYFTAPTAKPGSSRSSIFVSRASVPKSLSLTVTDAVSSERVPVVRLPSPSEQPRTYTKSELDALVRAGYTVTPVHDPQAYLKPKRQHQPVAEVRTNHVVYENPQDGIQYQYSPGTSDPTVTIKTKKSVAGSEYQEA